MARTSKDKKEEKTEVRKKGEGAYSEVQISLRGKTEPVEKRRGGERRRRKVKSKRERGKEGQKKGKK